MGFDMNSGGVINGADPICYLLCSFGADVYGGEYAGGDVGSVTAGLQVNGV